MSTLGERLRKARERKGLSQTEVYRRTNINNKTLSRYESGGSEPDLDTLRILAEQYEVSINYLTGISLQEAEEQFLEEFQKLDKKDQEYIIDLMQRIQKK